MRTVMAWLLMLAAGSTAAQALTPMGAASSVEPALRKLDDAELAGISKREVKFVDSVYARDVELFPPYGQFKVQGLDLVRDAWRSVYGTFATITRCEWTERRYHASGGGASAWMTCLWYLEGTNSDGQTQQMVLRVTRQYERRGARWLVVHEHLSAAMR